MDKPVSTRRMRFAVRCGVPVAALVALTLSSSGLAAATAASTPAKPAAHEILSSIKNPAARALVDDGVKAFNDGNAQQALVLLRKALAIEPKGGGIRTIIGRILLRTDNAPGAERELRQARRDGMPDRIVLTNLFQAMLAQHEEQKLLDEFPEPSANGKGGPNTDIMRGRAEAMLALGHLADAAAEADRGLAIHRTRPLLLLRAKIATAQKNLPLAGTIIDEALKQDPTYGPAMEAKLAWLKATKDANGALAMSEQILKEFHGDATSRRTRIDIFLARKQNAKADAEIALLAADMPKAPLTNYYRAIILARTDVQGAWRVAQSLPAELVQSDPSYAMQVAQMAIGSGYLETGAAILAAALAQSPDQLDLRLELASVRMKQNSPEAAFAVLEPVKDSNDPRVRAMIAQIGPKPGKKP